MLTTMIRHFGKVERRTCEHVQLRVTRVRCDEVQSRRSRASLRMLGGCVGCEVDEQV